MTALALESSRRYLHNIQLESNVRKLEATDPKLRKGKRATLVIRTELIMMP